jgi:hypothetical protein
LQVGDCIRRLSGAKLRFALATVSDPWPITGETTQRLICVVS